MIRPLKEGRKRSEDIQFQDGFYMGIIYQHSFYLMSKDLVVKSMFKRLKMGT
jgi:hypothetical protein